MSGHILGYYSCGEVVLLAYSRQRPGWHSLSLYARDSIPRSTTTPKKNDLVQGIGKAEKAWVRGKGEEDCTALLRSLL